MRGYLYLVISILFEIIGSAFLKLSDGFTSLWPSVMLVLFYGLSFTIFVFALKTVSLSVGYSLWAALGTSGTALVGVLLFNEVLTGMNLLGLFIIVCGVVVMNMKKSEETSEEIAR